MNERVSIITVTLNRSSLYEACRSVDQQTYKNWHHYVLGDGVLPTIYDSEQRSILGFSKQLGFTEPGANMPNGTPNPLLRWALNHLDLGDYVCFLDDDNEYDPYFIEKMEYALDNNADKGIALCGANDLRYFQNIDGHPVLGQCDNSAFMVRRNIAKTIEFPYASMDKNVVQDVEFIKLCSERYGYVNVPEKLLTFGSGLNLQPQRGKYLFIFSWKLPQDAKYCAYRGEYAKAVDMLNEAIKLNTYDAWSVWTLAEVLSVMNKKEEAIKLFYQWREMFEKADPEDYNYAALYRYAVVLKILNKSYGNIIEQVISEVDKKISIESNAIENYYDKIVYHFIQEDYDTMLEYLNKVVKLNTDKSFWAHVGTKWSFQFFLCWFDNKDLIESILVRL